MAILNDNFLQFYCACICDDELPDLDKAMMDDEAIMKFLMGPWDKL